MVPGSMSGVRAPSFRKEAQVSRLKGPCAANPLPGRQVVQGSTWKADGCVFFLLTPFLGRQSWTPSKRVPMRCSPNRVSKRQTFRGQRGKRPRFAFWPHFPKGRVPSLVRFGTGYIGRSGHRGSAANALRTDKEADLKITCPKHRGRAIKAAVETRHL